VGDLLNSTGDFFLLLSDVSIDFHAHDYFTTHLTKEFNNLFVGGSVIETEPGEEGPSEVNASIQLRIFKFV
jgi:hypothetical protein